jgi:hypothetical protein
MNADKNKKKEYNIEYYSSKKNVLIKCECGGTYKYYNKTNHIKTNKHKVLNTLNIVLKHI